jgi:nitrite reductase/ring-hydroxylating ferredoxin subunit
MAAFALDGVELVLCNVAGVPHVIEDRCPHAEAALSEGRLAGAVLECPLHGGKLDVTSGAPAAPPIRRPVRTFAVRRDGERLQVATNFAAEPPCP